MSPLGAGPRGVGGRCAARGAEAPAPGRKTVTMPPRFVDEDRRSAAARSRAADGAAPIRGAGRRFVRPPCRRPSVPCSGDERGNVWMRFEPQVAGQQPAAVGREGDAVEVGLLCRSVVDAAGPRSGRRARAARRPACRGEERDCLRPSSSRVASEAPFAIEAHEAGGRAAVGCRSPAGSVPLRRSEGQAHERRRLVAGLADCVEAASVAERPVRRSAMPAQPPAGVASPVAASKRRCGYPPPRPGVAPGRGRGGGAGTSSAASMRGPTSMRGAPGDAATSRAQRPASAVS